MFSFKKRNVFRGINGKVRRRIKLEEKKDKVVRISGEALDAYVKAKTLTWSAASAKDIPSQVRQFVEIVRERTVGIFPWIRKMLTARSRVVIGRARKGDRKGWRVTLA